MNVATVVSSLTVSDPEGSGDVGICCVNWCVITWSRGVKSEQKCSFLFTHDLVHFFHNWSRLIHRHSIDSVPVILYGKASGLI